MVMKRVWQPSRQGGFSLIELLVSITILSVGLLALAQMQTIGMNTGSIAQKITVATSLGREAMEDVLSWDPANASLNASGSNLPYPPGLPTPAVFSAAGAGNFTITFSTTKDTPAVGTTKVDVTVTGRGIQPVVITAYKKVV
jgi:type IV pilus assembly protein PilV